jgi:hypothetical protein
LIKYCYRDDKIGKKIRKNAFISFCKFGLDFSVCGADQLSCGDGRQCVPKRSYCDGHPDCLNGADEPQDCHLCASYLRIVDPSKICDGNRNCLDKSDERWDECGCREGYFQCFQKGHCIPPSFECDGQPDCPDGEDESNCVAVRDQRAAT